MRTVSSAVVAGALLLMGCGTELGPPPSASGEPMASTSDELQKSGFVQTPFGFVHSSCVREVDENVTIDGDRLIAADASEQTLSPCRHPVVRRASLTTGRIDGWVEAANWAAPVAPTALSATWVVPPAPSSVRSQLIYFFPSFEPARGDKIVQPVMQFGRSPAGGGAYWGVASWYVTADGTALHSKLLRVNTGDTIIGTMTTSSCKPSGGCKFKIVSRDDTTGSSKSLSVTTAEPYTLVQGAVLEAYGVTSCDQFPAGHELTFSALQVKTPVSAPEWKPWSFSLGLDCGFSVSSSAAGDSATLRY